MKIRIIEGSGPGDVLAAKYSGGAVDITSFSYSPVRQVFYITAGGAQPNVRLSPEYASHADASSAWRNGFIVERDGDQTAETLLAEGVAQLVP